MSTYIWMAGVIAVMLVFIVTAYVGYNRNIKNNEDIQS
jgi:hypothetical protein